MKNWVINVVLIVSIAFFVTSLAIPVFDTNVTYLIEHRMHSPSRTYLGYEVLLFGWASLFFGVFAWFANVAYFVTLIFVRSGNKLSLPISVTALLIALTSLSKPIIERGDNGYDFYISEFEWGFYVWLGAIASSIVGALITRTR